jgi:NADPH2:quinone reductase
MRAVQIIELGGPDALGTADLAEPEADHFTTPGEGVLIAVENAAVSFPDVLQTRGLYQVKPELPFVPGHEVAGIVVRSTEPSRFRPGDRVAALTMVGGMAERAAAPLALTFHLPDSMEFPAGAAFVLNYHTAYFALQLRGRLREGENVVVHGAGGGLGSASVQVAKALGARVIAVVSSESKARIASEAGADDVVNVNDGWKDEIRQLTSGGADIVIDPVGGDRVVDSLRALREDGRLVVLGFASGAIPEIRLNRLLLNNLDVVGAAWGGYAFAKPDLCREIGDHLDDFVRAGSVRPLVGERFPLERAADAMRAIENREATGKVVLDVGAADALESDNRSRATNGG